MILTFREVRQWPGEKTAQGKRVRSKFKAAVDVVGRLRLELQRLGAARATLSGFWSQQNLKRDGSGPYADARPSEPGIMVEWERGSAQYVFATDRFLTWQDNAHAITSVLEDVRRMERYGVTSGQLLEGFRKLPASASGHVMTPEEAAFVLADNDDVIALAILHDARLIDVYAKVARNTAHPDKGGSDEAFVRIDKAVEVLKRGAGA